MPYLARPRAAAPARGCCRRILQCAAAGDPFDVTAASDIGNGGRSLVTVHEWRLCYWRAGAVGNSFHVFWSPLWRWAAKWEGGDDASSSGDRRQPEGTRYTGSVRSACRQRGHPGVQAPPLTGARTPVSSARVSGIGGDQLTPRLFSVLAALYVDSQWLGGHLVPAPRLSQPRHDSSPGHNAGGFLDAAPPPSDRPVEPFLVGRCPYSPLAAGGGGGPLAGSGDADGGVTPPAVTLPPPFPRGRILRRRTCVLACGGQRRSRRSSLRTLWPRICAGWVRVPAARHQLTN